MGQYNENWVDGTTLKFPRAGFWGVHLIGAVVIFLLGMRFSVRRAPFPIIAYKILKMLAHR
ncbi:MAG: hypothetical protein H6Q74_581 [Firmicutes bacterium]|nr:hypothetical protein [Bacillota bacterium]